VTIQVLPPIDIREQLGEEPSERTVSELVTTQMQDALDELSVERDLPVVGSITPRDDDIVI